METMSGTLLVIDDSSLVSEYIVNTFFDEAIHVILAEHADKGFEKAVEYHPDMILLDIVLPEKDGFTLCAQLKSDMRTMDIPIIFITAGRDEASIAKGFELGAVDYISKPFRGVELKARVRSHLENQRYRNTLNKVNLVLNKALEENRRLSETDPLTGVFNRRYFTDQIIQVTSKVGQLSLAFGDIDDFKLINDNFGHLAGDNVLCTIAQLIQEGNRSASSVSRWGGEEFAIMLHTMDLEQAFIAVEKMRTQIERHMFTYNQLPIKCTMTFSVMEYDLAKTLNENLDLLDAALYRGKRKGKNCCIMVR